MTQGLMGRLLARVPKSLKDLEWFYKVNPTHPPNIIPALAYRYPAPGSRPAYGPPAAPNDRPAKNYYFNRDARRSWPAPATYTPADVAALAGGAPQGQLSAPGAAGATGGPPGPVYHAGRLPPIPNNKYRYAQGVTVDHQLEYNPVRFVR